MLRKVLFGMMLGAILFASMFANIFLHEEGHYAVAKSFDLSPKIHIGEVPAGEKSTFFVLSFYTTYLAKTNSQQDAEIAFAGPLVNLLLTCIFACLYFVIPKKVRGRTYLEMILLVLLIPSLVSFIVNILPIPYSDGSVIFSFITSRIPLVY